MSIIGPKPYVDVPALPTPWTTKGALVYDANGAQVLTISPNEGFPADRMDVATAVADTMNRAHVWDRVDTTTRCDLMPERDTITDHTPTDADLRHDAEAAYHLARVAFDRVHKHGLRVVSTDECANAASALATSIATLSAQRDKEAGR